ncbi:hypothetical protein [Pigmentiphaga humi]|nr:hypothetical protein [Pigmentiphaga humi]
MNGRTAWLFVPRNWNVAELESTFPFSGLPGTPHRRALVALDVAKDLLRTYGGQPLLELPGEPTLDALLSRELAAVRMSISRDQDAAGSAMPL